MRNGETNELLPLAEILRKGIKAAQYQADLSRRRILEDSLAFIGYEYLRNGGLALKKEAENDAECALPSY